MAKLFRIFSLGFACFLSLLKLAQAEPNSECPCLILGETALDCPWAEVSRSSEKIENFDELTALFETKIPKFLDQLRNDSLEPVLFEAWANSKNFDVSNPQSPIVPKNILRFFKTILEKNQGNLPYDENFQIGHAGLNHTYGYLFSTLKTPFGFKRARYVQGELESGFGLTPGLLSGLPKEGSLLKNFTAFLSRIALSDSKINQRFSQVAPEIESYPFEDLKITLLTEQATNGVEQLELRTHFVEFPKKNLNGQNEALLIYSIHEMRPGKPSEPKLITAFPILKSFMNGPTSAQSLGEKQPIMIRYNGASSLEWVHPNILGKRSVQHDYKPIEPNRNRS